MKSPRSIRLIALDVDGTLLTDGKELPAVNREALHAAQAKGVHIAIATGRMIPSIEPIEELLGMDCALIAYNGAKVVTPRAEGRECIQHKPLDPGLAGRLLVFARDGGYLLNFYIDDVLYAEEPVSEEGRRLAEIYATRTGAKYHFTDLDRFAGRSPTKAILLADPQERDRLWEHFRAELDGQATVTRSDPEYLEFMARDVNKGTALPVLAGHFGISTSEILAMGDADNDQELLEQAGLGVAVANARDVAKKAARFVTRRTSAEGAVAEAVERWVLGKEPW